jgi:hypothetical protein
MKLRAAAVLVVALWLVASIQFLTEFKRDSKAASDQWVKSEVEEKLVLKSLVLNFPASILLVNLGAFIPIGHSGPVLESVLLSASGLAQ